MAGIGATGSVGAYAAQSDYSKSTKTKKPEVFGTPDKTAGTTGTGKTSQTAQTRGKTEDYGRTIGQPELSEKAAKYYEQLKKRYGNYDFILVSRDQKENEKPMLQNMPMAIRRLFSLMRTRSNRWQQTRNSANSMRES